MKLTTKRDRWYFWRELFSYMIPMILIVGSVDVFRNFMICPLHPEWSAPCSVNWIIAAIYGAFLVIVIILELISAKMLGKIKKKIEDEFLEITTHTEDEPKKIEKKSKKIGISKPKKIVIKSDKIKDNKKVVNGKTTKTDEKKVKMGKNPTNRRTTKK